MIVANALLMEAATERSLAAERHRPTGVRAAGGFDTRPDWTPFPRRAHVRLVDSNGPSGKRATDVGANYCANQISLLP